ncbi:MAG TPA: hypothetical protein DCS11_08625 [Syntrophus sp. (in: bacteria)]|jgi:hypothetical protein|nr:hypothetical protein [Syntrophus sp. (in: bacteria)]
MNEYRILLYRFPERFMKVRLGLLARPPFIADSAPRPGEFFHRLEMAHYRMLILTLPDPEMDLEDLLPLIRKEGAPSARCSLIVLAAPRHLSEFRLLLGKGLNALVSLDDPPETLEAAIARQVEVAPRVEVRVMVRLQARLVHDMATLLCQTANLSASGMFLELNRKIPVGSEFVFELAIPGAKDPVAGTGAIIRHANPEREGRDGMGAAFTAFRGGGEVVLKEYLQRRAGP